MNRGRNAARTAFSGILTALGVVLLFAGYSTGVLDLCAAAASALLIAVSVTELGGVYPYMIWAATSVISLVLIPDKSVGAEYFFFGVYPVFKLYFERLPKIFEIAAKFIYAAFSGAVLYFFIRFVLNMSEMSGGLWIAEGAAYAFFFAVYDRDLSTAMAIYMIKLRPKLKFLKRL